MRTIKFRGKTLGDELVYGDVIHYRTGEVAIADEYRSVLPESVSQLVGYDADGNEVYEGDQLIRLDGVIGFLAPDVVTDYPDYKLAK